MKGINAWFLAASRDDFDGLWRNMQQFSQRYDERQSQNQLVFRGFYAIHYAALSGSVRAFQTLTASELLCQTKEPVDLHLSATDVVSVPAGQTALTFALLKNHWGIVSCIIEALDADPETGKRFAALVDKHGKPALFYTWFVRDQMVLSLLRNRALQGSLLAAPQHENFVLEAARQRNDAVLGFIASAVTGAEATVPGIRHHLAMLLLRRDSQDRKCPMDFAPALRDATLAAYKEALQLLDARKLVESFTNEKSFVELFGALRLV